MESIDALAGKYVGTTCNIVARGPSLLKIERRHFDRGPIIAINQAIEHVEKLPQLDHDIYSMQKDGKTSGEYEPRSPLLLSKRQSSMFYQDRADRYVFDTESMNGGGDAISAVMAIKIAKLMGCDAVKFLCFDAMHVQDYRSLVGYDAQRKLRSKFKAEEKMVKEALSEAGYELNMFTPGSLLFQFRVMDSWHVIQGRRYPKWRGSPILKHPGDLILYHQAIWKNKPDFIIEAGTKRGGSALFFADMLAMAGGRGRVITIDVHPLSMPKHDRVEYIIGSSTDRKIVDAVKEKVVGKGSVMVVLDSAHDRAHVKRELYHYGPIVTKGQYLVVEDYHTRGGDELYGPGEAMEWYLRRTNKFRRSTVDRQFLSLVTRSGWMARV